MAEELIIALSAKFYLKLPSILTEIWEKYIIIAVLNTKMIIKSLKLTNFRNYTGLDLSFDSDINVLVGDNGVGKTNILEAIYLLSTTRSFRARYDSDLISYDQNFTNIEAEISSDEETDKILMQIVRTERSDKTSVKKVKLNNVAKPLSKFTHHLKSVLFSPEDIDVITGSPSQRRKYLDLILFQVDTKYKKCSSDYQKAVRRRNKVLELISETGSGADQLPYWNDKILEQGEYIQQKRSEVLAFFNSYFRSSSNPYSNYSHGLKTSYEQNLIDTKRLLEYKSREIGARTTLIGPHRDDFTLYLQEKDMAQFASRGEQRTAMFLMKLAEFQYIFSKLDIKPVLLLDDIFSELDPEHKEAILSFINSQQTIITTASVAELPDMNISNTITLPLTTA